METGDDKNVHKFFFAMGNVAMGWQGWVSSTFYMGLTATAISGRLTWAKQIERDASAWQGTTAGN